ncbi:MAG: hypothetical protein EOM34_07100 [Clostridia bacterium]|nr:hypothetical protein [Lachnospiraceae bacterium]NCC00434.1 hypothetical protein [Clostridia bacterium]
MKNYEVINKLAEKQGKTLTAKDYDNVIKYNNAIKDNREKELKTLQAEYDNLMKNQEGFVGTDKWFEMQETMMSLKNEIADVNLELEDVKDNVHEANWDNFTKNVEANKDKIDELGRAIDLLNEDNFFTEDGGLTSEGLTKYALLGQQLNTAKKQVAEYENAINKLNDDLKKGNITQSEYTELLRDYRDESQSAADDVNEYRKAMVELTKEGIEKQVDAQKELISGRKEALRTQKEYDDYQKKIRDKNKDILSIQSQLAVLDGQTGAEAERKRRELQAQLRELEEERQELVEDRNYDMILNGYDELEDEIDKKYDEITQKLDSSLTKRKMLEEKVAELAEKIDSVIDPSQMTLDELKEFKCKEIQKEISDIIESGVDVELPSGMEHFSLTTLDQINIDKLERRSDKLQVSLPYHSDKFACKFYTPKELALISIVADAYVTQFTTLINSYNVWIRRCTMNDEVMAITSNSSLPADLQEHMTSILTQLNATIEGYIAQMTEPVNPDVEVIPPSEVEVIDN